MVIAYLCTAARRRAKPDLTAATHIAVATVGTGGAVRLVGFVFFGDFVETARLSDHGWWSLAPEDAIFLIIGGIALAWASCQQIVAAFAGLKPIESSSPSGPAEFSEPT